MTIDPSHVGIILGASVLGVVIDCNRRVRALQRTSNLHIEWLGAMIHGRRPKRASDGIDKPRRRRR
jgi:hypothetical protein